MGVEREHLEGKVHAWETPWELPAADSPWGRGSPLSTLLLLYSPLLLTCPWALLTKREVERGAIAKALWQEHLSEGHWDSGLPQASPRCRSCSFTARGFPLCCCWKLYSQLLCTHETLVGVLLARGIPNRVVLPRAGQPSSSLELRAILTAVILWKEGSG